MNFISVLTQDRSKMMNALQFLWWNGSTQYGAVLEVDMINKLMGSRLTGGVSKVLSLSEAITSVP